MGFPHVPYIFLTFAALVAILVKSAREQPAGSPTVHGPAAAFGRRRVHVLQGGSRRVHNRRGTD
jgi:hypothetical protein